MSAATTKEIFVFAGFTLDPRQRLLFGLNGEPISLTARAFDTLLYLVEHPNQLVDKHTLMKAVWPNAIVEENNLSQSIVLVRRALGETPGEHHFVVTVPGRGFRFVPQVERLDVPVSPIRGESSDSAAPLGPARPLTFPPDLVSAGSNQGKTERPALWLSGVVATAAAALLGGYLLARHFRVDVESVQVGPFRGSLSAAATTSRVNAPAAAGVSAPGGTAAKPRLAVLPFENLSPDPANAFFADGLYEEILATLAQRAPDLEVISRTTMMTYRTHPKSVSELARDLHATHVIEGSVRRDAGRVRLTLQLIDARTDSHVWSQSYDRTLVDALTLESQVADEVASQLSARLAAPPTASRQLTKDPQAYDLYLKALIARESVTDTGSMEPISKVDGLLSRAIARDPLFARAYAQRVGIGLFAWAFSFDTSDRKLRTIQADLETARRLAPDDPEVLAAAGRYAAVVEQDYERSLALLEQAKRANLADIMWLGGAPDTLSHMGRFDEAVREVQRLIAIDPENGFLRGQLCLTLYSAKRPSDLVQELDREISSLRDRGPAPADDLRRLQSARAWVVRMYTGRGTDKELDFSFPELYTDLDFGTRVLRIERRYRDIERLVATHSGQSVKTSYVGGVTVYAIGDRPVAEFVGWADLLLGDRVAAATQGRAVLDFVSRAHETRFNQWFLRGLEASGYAFLGRNGRAVSAARDSLSLAAKSRDPFNRPAAASMAAQVFAWCGAQREATAQLAELAAAVPGLSYGVIVQDPIYAMPLARDSLYQNLVARLDARMRMTQLP